MTLPNYTLPGYYKLVNATITTYSGKDIDIVNLIPRFSIEESLENDCMRGTATVYDNVGLLERVPLRGEERFRIVVEDPFGLQKTFRMFIYKVSNVTIKNTNDGTTYDIFFMSESRMFASARRIVKSYNVPISQIVQNIYENYYTTNTPLFVEDTEGIFKCLIPNYTPIQAMYFLSSRSYSTQSASCSFRFFENNEGYYFVSDEYLVKNGNETNNIKEFTFSDQIDKSGLEFLQQMQNLITLDNTDRTNTLKDLYSGGYTSNVIEIDLLKKKVTDRRYVYKDERKNYFKLNNVTLQRDEHSDQFIEDFFNSENERKFLLFKDYQSLGDIPGALRSEQFLPEIVSNKLAYRHHLNGNRVSCRIYGRLDLKAGDIVNLKVPEFTAITNKSTLNNQLSGNYLVQSLVHTFNLDKYEIMMTLLKYDWAR